MANPGKVSTREIPAALVRLLAQAQRLLVSTDSTPHTAHCDVALSGKAGEFLPLLLAHLEDAKRGLTG